MAEKRKYIKSSTGYVQKSLHQLTPDGNIFERDFMTITDLNTFAPGQIPIYNDSNFIFTVRKHKNGQYNVVNGAWLKSDKENDFWTSNNLGEVSKTADSSYIKPYYSSLTDFAYYGSAVELIRSTINSIIKNFPAGIYISNKSLENFITGIDKDGKLEYGLSEYFLVENPFHIDISSASVGNVTNPYRYFCLTWQDFCIDGKPITWSPPEPEPGEREKCPKNGDSLRTITISGHKIEYRFVDGVEIACSKSSDVLIRPKESVLNTFLKDLSDFGKVLLNKDTNPRYKASFDAYFEDSNRRLRMLKKNYIWPVAKYGYNLEISDNRFKEYIQGLTELATFYDEFWSDNFYRAMAHESVKNLDWTFARLSADENIDNDDLDFSRMQMYMRIYGRQLDEIKRHIDGIGFTNNISYNQENNPTDYTLTDALELAGWEVKNLFTKDDGLPSDILYSGESVGYTTSEANNEFLRRLKLNSPYILSQKGTKKGLRTLLSLFGMKEKKGENGSNYHYEIKDYVYNATLLDNVDQVKNYNTQKTSFNITYQNEYGDLSGIPVKEQEIKGKNYLIPWFDANKKYDTPMYFEMAGGWDGRSKLKVQDINGIETEIAGDLYKETQKHVKYVNTIDELLNLRSDFVENGDFVYVYDINNSDVPENSSHYFYIEDINYIHYIDYESKELFKGWYPVTIDEISSENQTNMSKIGEKLLLYLSYKEDTIGNNPHFGNKKYDGGQSWADRFNSIFKESIEKLGAFVGVDGVKEEEVAELGFRMTTAPVNEKTFIVDKNGMFQTEPIYSRLNTKQMTIEFTLRGVYSKEFIEEYVLFYLKQMIPSTTIFKISYKEQYEMQGIPIGTE